VNSLDLVVDDLLNLNVVADAQISPLGDRVAYTISENGTDRGAVSDQQYLVEPTRF
jgi:hypothetical protein